MLLTLTANASPLRMPQPLIRSATSRKLSSPAVRIWRSCAGEGITTRLGSYCGGLIPATGLSSNRPSRFASSRIAFSLSKQLACAARPIPLRSRVWRKLSTTLWSKVFIRRLPSSGSRWMFSSDSRCTLDAGPRSRWPAFHSSAYSWNRIAPYLAIRSAFACPRGAAFFAL